MQTRVENAPLSPAALPVSIDTPASTASGEGTQFAVLGGISFAHMLNDMIQSLILAIYPLLKNSFHLSFAQIGLITLTYQVTASLLQPLVGILTDRRPMPYSLPTGMGFTLCGLLLLAVAPNFAVLLMAAALVGTGSAVFHPESSRVARLASGGRHGLAQSLFQARCWPRGSSCRTGAVAWPGSRWRRCWRSWCCYRSGAGTASIMSRAASRLRAARRWHRCHAISSSARWRSWAC
jgi:MFS family permease